MKCTSDVIIETAMRERFAAGLSHGARFRIQLAIGAPPYAQANTRSAALALSWAIFPAMEWGLLTAKTVTRAPSGFRASRSFRRNTA